MTAFSPKIGVCTTPMNETAFRVIARYFCSFWYNRRTDKTSN